MTGLGAARMLRDNDVHPLYFVDSDPGFKNKTVAGLQVVLLAQLKQMIDQSERPTAILAVALKETDILKSLEALGITGVDVVFQDNDAPYFTVDILGSWTFAAYLARTVLLGMTYHVGRCGLKISRR